MPDDRPDFNGSNALPKPPDDLPADHSATAAGRYRILRPLGHGGLGEVFLASDEELHRQVALKEILPALAHDPDLRTRFLVEAEITGGLEHPGIVPVYGLGAYDDGRPFYAMRFIRGESLSTAIARLHGRQEPLSDPSQRSVMLRKLLASFITVCNTMAYAHSRGVIHRDLKPDNVLLGPYGETLLVDWGLAKLVARPERPTRSLQETDGPKEQLSTFYPSAAAYSTPTQMGTAVGTPAYMSPEQAAGLVDQVGPASDIYSLGATLYVLLTGELPFSGSTPEETLQQIILGRSLPPRKRNPEIPPALEAICVKAMALDPARRYASAGELADDLEAWLADAPVKAWREPWRVRLGRWTRRHRTLVAGAATAAIMAVFSLCLGIALLTAANQRLREARDLAHEREVQSRRNFRMARDAVDTYLTRVSQDPRLAAHDLESLRRDLLQTARAFYEQFVTYEPKDPELQWERAWACFRLAELTNAIGSLPEAISLLERARDIFQTLSRQFPQDPKYSSGLARSQVNLGLLLLQTGRPKDSESELHSARQTLQELASRHPETVAFQVDLADAHQNLARLHTEAKQFDAAQAEYQKALAVRRRLTRTRPEESDFQSALADTQADLGLLYHRCGRHAEAAESLRSAQEIQQRLVAQHAKSLQYQSDLAKTSNNLAALYADLPDRTADAEAAYKTAIEVCQRLAMAHHDVSQYQRDLARSHNNLATLYCQHGRLEDGERAYVAAREIHQRLADNYPDVPDHQNDLAATLNNLGNLDSDLQHYEEAEAAYRRAIEIRQRLTIRYPDYPDYQSDLATTYNNVGTLLSQLGRMDEAETAHEAALKIRSKLAKRYDHVIAYVLDLGTTYANLTQLACSRERFEQADRYSEQAIALLQTDGNLRFDRPLARQSLRNAYWGRAEARARLGRHAEALDAWDRAIALDAGESRDALRLGRAESLARSGQHARAAAEAHELLTPAQDYGPVLYRLAAIDSLASAAAAKDTSLTPAERIRLAEQYAAESVAILQKAKLAGYFDDPAHQQQLNEDPQLTPLRPRDDFRHLTPN